MHAVGFSMALDMVDLIWSAMQDGEFYSPNDLANSLEQPVESVTRVLEFLKKYKFTEQVTRREMIFRKVANNPSPGDALRVLQTVLGEVRVERTERANVSGACKRFTASP
jgi:hypothetical protein